jgi:hypothetical protein
MDIDLHNADELENLSTGYDSARRQSRGRNIWSRFVPSGGMSAPPPPSVPPVQAPPPSGGGFQIETQPSLVPPPPPSSMPPSSQPESTQPDTTQPVPMPSGGGGGGGGGGFIEEEEMGEEVLTENGEEKRIFGMKPIALLGILAAVGAAWLVFSKKKKKK